MPETNNNWVSNEAIAKRILNHFKKIAPRIVNESSGNISPENPFINCYDADSYMEKMEGAFDDIDEKKLRGILFEHIEEINAIFFAHNKNARKS